MVPAGTLWAFCFPVPTAKIASKAVLLPYQGETLKANEPLILNALIFGGRGNSAVDAIKHFVAWHGLPKIPDAGTFENYNALTSAGWLDSKIREGDLFRHAYWPGFDAKTAADAPLLMEWLAAQNSPRGAELKTIAQSALAQVKPENYNATNVSHITYPAAALVYGGVEANAERAAQNARNLLKRFDENNRVLYQKRPDGGDFGSTHFAPDANGLTAQVVASVLENASFSGDKDLIDEGIKKLRALDKFIEQRATRRADVGSAAAHAGYFGFGAFGARLHARLRTNRRQSLFRASQILGMDGRAVCLLAKSDNGKRWPV